MDTYLTKLMSFMVIAAIVFWFLAAIASSIGVKTEKKEEADSAMTEPLIPGENL